MNSFIPNYIFQTWKTKDADSKRTKYINTIKLFNPNSEYFLYDDYDCDKFVRDKFPQYYPFYKQLKLPVQKADLWRYLIIYYYGGYYLDIDCKAVRSFNNVYIPNKYRKNKNLLIVETENPAPLKPLDGYPRNPQYAQYWFGATPSHPAIMKVIQRVIHNIKVNKNSRRVSDGATLYLTGPVPWTDGINDYQHSNHSNEVYMIRRNLADVCSVGIDTQLLHKYKNTPIIHQAAGSWRDKTKDNDSVIVLAVTILTLVLIYLVIRIYKG